MNYSNIDKEQVLELHQAGNSIRQISSYTNIPKSTVADWIKECSQSTPKEVSDCNPDAPDMTSGHPEESTFSDDPDTFQGEFPENIGQTGQEDLSDVSEPDKLPLEKTEDSNLSINNEWIKLKKKEIEQRHQRKMRKMDQSDADRNLREREVQIQESLARKERTRLKLQEREYVDNLKSIARYYQRKKDWTTDELLRLQERVAKLKTKMENFYSKYSSMDWGKDGLKYLFDIEDDIEESLDCEEEDPLELVPSKMMNSVFENIKEL